MLDATFTIFNEVELLILLDFGEAKALCPIHMVCIGSERPNRLFYDTGESTMSFVAIRRVWTDCISLVKQSGWAFCMWWFSFMACPAENSLSYALICYRQLFAICCLCAEYGSVLCKCAYNEFRHLENCYIANNLLLLYSLCSRELFGLLVCEGRPLLSTSFFYKEATTNLHRSGNWFESYSCGLLGEVKDGE